MKNGKNVRIYKQGKKKQAKRKRRIGILEKIKL